MAQLTNQAGAAEQRTNNYINSELQSAVVAQLAFEARAGAKVTAMML